VLYVSLLKMSKIRYLPSLALFRAPYFSAPSDLSLRLQSDAFLSPLLPRSAVDLPSGKEKIERLRINRQSLTLGSSDIADGGYYLHECFLHGVTTTSSMARLISSRSGKRSKISRSMGRSCLSMMEMQASYILISKYRTRVIYNSHQAVKRRFE
jgi:hypothetical protein